MFGIGGSLPGRAILQPLQTEQEVRSSFITGLAQLIVAQAF
jgi:hypothetical protein